MLQLDLGAHGLLGNLHHLERPEVMEVHLYLEDLVLPKRIKDGLNQCLSNDILECLQDILGHQHHRRLLVALTDQSSRHLQGDQELQAGLGCPGTMENKCSHDLRVGCKQLTSFPTGPAGPAGPVGPKGPLFPAGPGRPWGPGGP